MLLYVLIALIGGVTHVCSKALVGKCSLNEVFQSYLNEKVNWALTARDVEEMKKDFAKLRKQIDEIPKPDPDCQYPVAFFVKKKKTNHKDVVGGQKLVYDTIVTDTCHNFDNDTGTFICPKNGVYIFHFNALNKAKKEAGLALYKNGAEIIRVWADDNGTHESSGNSVVLQLVKRDKIYVKIQDGFSVTLHGQFNTFSGHIIQK